MNTSSADEGLDAVSVHAKRGMEAGTLDWADRGTSHVDFKPQEELPLTQGKFLGHGMSGGVYETVCKGVRLAWKTRFCRKRIGTAELKEMDILKKLQHKHIVKLVGTYTRGSFLGLLLWPVAVCDLGIFLQDLNDLPRARIGLAMNFDADDDTQDNDEAEQRLDQLGLDASANPESSMALAKFRLRQSVRCITSAIAYLHRNRIRHKDIKPSNILLSRDSLWITDFGTSTDFSEFAESVTDNGERGTPKYFAPEVAEFQPNGRSADVFSLGCVFLEMLGVCNGYSLEDLKNLRPERDRSFHANLSRIMKWFNFGRIAVASVVDLHLLGVVRQMLSLSPDDRPTAQDIEMRFNLVGALDAHVPYGATQTGGKCCKPAPVTARDGSVSDQLSDPPGPALSRMPLRMTVGNLHRLGDYGGHVWRVFLEPSSEGYIDTVHFLLHPSFPEPHTAIEKPPWIIEGSGWGYFTLDMLVVLKEGYHWIHEQAGIAPDGRSLLPLRWTLDFGRPKAQTEVQADIGVGW